MQVTHTFKRNWFSTKRIVINRGGTRSSKTFSICQQLINWLFFGEIRNGQTIEKGRAAVVRQFRATIRVTVMRDFETMLKNLGLFQYVKENRRELSFEYNGRIVEFIGADDEHKLHGYKCNILYCNEAIDLTYEKFRQLEFRCTDLIILDFNPRDPYTWINTKLEQVRQHRKGDVEVIISTYLDNPYLTQFQIGSIEYAREEDDIYWKVYGLGEYGDILGLVFPNVTFVDEMPNNLRNHGFGMDFGYNDPTTLIECGLLNRNDLYLNEWLYMGGMTTGDIDMTLKVFNFDKRKWIHADSSHPMAIKDLQNWGYKVRAAKKGPDSILHGINKINQCKIHITKSSANINWIVTGKPQF